MKRRDFIGEACKFAVLCSSPILLSTLQSCEDNVDDSVVNDDFIDINEDFIEFVSKIARSYLFFFISFANLYLRTALKSPCAKLDSIETDTSGILLNKDIDHEGEKTSS